MSLSIKYEISPWINPPNRRVRVKRVCVQHDDREAGLSSTVIFEVEVPPGVDAESVNVHYVPFVLSSGEDT